MARSCLIFLVLVLVPPNAAQNTSEVTPEVIPDPAINAAIEAITAAITANGSPGLSDDETRVAMLAIKGIAGQVCGAGFTQTALSG